MTTSTPKHKRLLPGQRPDETEEEYTERLAEEVERRVADDGAVPGRFTQRSRSTTLRREHPVFRTTNHDYGSLQMTEYERPPCYRVVSRHFTEKEHLGVNYEGGGFNI
jgi:hypothetical protein